MADLPTDDYMLQTYFNSDDNNSEFEGFSEQESDVDIPNVLESSDDEGQNESSDEEIADEVEWSANFHDVNIDDFNEDIGPQFPNGFDNTTASAKDYFDLMFDANIMADFVRHTNNYAKWKMEQSGEVDSVWYETTENELKAYFGMNIFMGINSLPGYKDYWSRDNFIGNEGIKSVMPVRRYEKLTEYFHVSNRAAEPARGEDNYDKLFKVRPVVNMAKDLFKRNYKPNKHMAIDEAMIKWTGRLSYKQYLPAKPIKRGIKVWMRCDADNAFLTDFNIYLGRGTHNAEHGLGYDVVHNLSRDLQGKNFHVFYDNYFTGVKLAEDMLVQKIYTCGTIRINRSGFPVELKGLKMRRGESKVLQKGNLVAAVWQDKKPVAFLSTLSDPRLQVNANRRVGRNNIQFNQPHAAYIYNQNMNGVDRHDQLRSCYALGRDGKKSWKYIFWFIMNRAIVNAHIIFSLSSRRVNSKKRFSHLDFRCELAHQLIAGFSGRKRNAAEMDNVEHNVENFAGHESVHMKCKRRCRVHMNRKERKETVYGCKLCNVHLCKDGCHYIFHGRPLNN